MKLLALATAALLAAPAVAQTAPAAPAPTAPTPRAPKLIVAISVDQLSSDLFQQYRRHFTGGFARLEQGAVFPSGYQGHSATETCPGHSTIMTGYRPDKTGIPANDWIDQRAARADKEIYCAEDETVPGSSHDNYTVSDIHLKVPTLGERIKAATPASRIVSVAGKDRAAVMMGGHRVDELWWWDGKTFASYAGRAMPPAVARARKSVADDIAREARPMALPAYCAAVDRAVRVGDFTIGRGRFARNAGDVRGFRYTPQFDAAVFALAADLVRDMKLGRGTATDVLTIGASATDYIGHAYGSQGAEMCIQLDQVDRVMATFFAALDRQGIDYQVVLTADHGGADAPERQREQALPDAVRVDPKMSATTIGEAIGKALSIAGPVLLASDYNLYIADNVPARLRPRVLAEAQRRMAAVPQIAAVFTQSQIAATPLPTTPPDQWSVIERVRASNVPGRSGDLYFVLRPEISSAATPGPTYVMPHGSPWDYDRRVPILFWRKGTAGFEQPRAVETVDIMPTLAALVGMPAGAVDGRCLDLDPGPASSCPS